MATEFYRLDGGRLTLREYWRMSPDALTFAIAAGAKLLFGGLPFPSSLPKHDRLHRVEWDAVPAAARRALSPFVQAVQDDGYAIQFCHRAEVLEPDRLGIAVVLLAADGRSFAAINHVREPSATKTEVSIVSRFADDSSGTTTVAAEQFRPNPAQLYDRHPRATPGELIAFHRKNLSRWDRQRAVVTLTAETLARAWLDAERGFIEYHVGRGVFVRMTDEEIELQRTAPRPTAD
ncbi:MAG: hypothetical protein ACRC7O_04585 [Fimbriiglobus sp.]